MCFQSLNDFFSISVKVSFVCLLFFFFFFFFFFTLNLMVPLLTPRSICSTVNVLLVKARNFHFCSPPGNFRMFSRPVSGGPLRRTQGVQSCGARPHALLRLQHLLPHRAQLRLRHGRQDVQQHLSAATAGMPGQSGHPDAVRREV